ncbi:GNAT family N-acetyltransferase [Arenibacter echinorum]|uniref:Acetyltransferase (GNAT) family protein n=1 Tax=Arenibacter echinorum TaxID=440515 RepID=A0A327RKJ7_9FLAO|nr:GNAT family N-acetyltransferase [Arenibacter echinorum]RAJ16033.1 acetyltransferase (GNAT) family protein [Arenibacter echinorum]
MIHRRLQKLNFYFEFFEKDSIFPFYESVNNNTNGEISVNQSTEEIGRFKNRVSIVNFIPPYLDLKINKKNTPFRSFQIKPRIGFIIDLSRFTSADNYLKLQLGSRKRKTILAGARKLETCFDINYKIYYGEISESEYEFLFSHFERMIKMRFEQRKQEHVGYKRWDLYKDNVYNLILKKRASLFVIYDKKKPIVIDLNYHFDNILDSAMSSYDIDYSKFGLGNIALLKQLEWCFENNYKRVDMRWGEVPYKRLWCNVIEDYKCEVVYNKNIPTDMLLALAISKFVNVKKILEDRKMLPLKLKFLSKGMKKNQPTEAMDTGPVYRIEDLTELPSKDILKPIDIREKEFQFLRSPIYNYQHFHGEHSSDINIYSVNNENMSYIIEGKSKLKTLTYNLDL